MDSWVRFSAQSQAKERVMSLIQIFSTDDVITPKLVQQEHIRCGRPCGGEAFMKSLADLRSALTLTYCQDCETGGLLLNISVHRAGQYTCMLLGYTLQRSKVSTELIRTVGDLEAHLSITRKLIRLGNSVDALQAAKRSIHLSDSVLRLCLTISHLNRAMYFACDNVLWAGKTGLVSKLDQKKWSQRSFRYYLFALILNLTRDLYELGLLLDSETRYQSTKGPLSPADPSSLPVWLPGRLRQILMVLHNNPPLLLDLLKNSCDVFIPLDRLGIYPTGPGFVGTCGLVSSVLSIITMVQPWLKLKP